MTEVQPWRSLSPFEVATGTVTGLEPKSTSVRKTQDLAPLEALEKDLLRFLHSAPCFVAFSGGRDSSAVLAATVAAARSHGLPDPVPISRHWPRHPEMDESRWQELVVRHLGLTEWVKVPYAEMDLVGPLCSASLVRHRVLWPLLLHTWGPVLQEARGGILLTGEGGDEIFGARRCTALRAVVDPRRKTDRALLGSALLSVAPRQVRRRALARQIADHALPWVRPDAVQDLRMRIIDDDVREPLLWHHSMTVLLRRRSAGIGDHNFAQVAERAGVELQHPLLDEHFLAAMAGATGALGPRGRTGVMRAIFGSLLPDAILARQDKVFTNTVCFSDATRDFADRWSGAGLDQSLVDPEALREVWRSARPHAASAIPLQAAFLADHPVLP